MPDVYMTSLLSSSPKRILITRLRFIGDVVLTLPVIQALRTQFPDAEIYYLAEQPMGEVLLGHPDLTGVILFDRDSIDAQAWYKRPIDHLRFILNLRKHQFDLVIDLFCNPRSALLTLLTGAGIRVGYDVRGRGVVYNIKIHRSSSPRVVDAYLDAVRTLGIDVIADRPRLILSADEKEWADTWLGEKAVTHGKKIIGLNPGASWPAKMWSWEKYAALADRIIDDHNADILVIQGPGQGTLAQQVADTMKHSPIIVDYLPIRQVTALINRCAVFVSNDSGPMHIAAAVETPTVGIFGPSDAEIWFPYSESNDCYSIKPDVPFCCGKDFCTEPVSCITTIGVDEVIHLVRKAMDGSP